MKMKSIKVTEQVHRSLVAYAAYLTLERRKQVSLNDAVEALLENSMKRT